MKIVYVGLDLATMAGFAFFEPETQLATVFQFQGMPTKQMFALIGMMDGWHEPYSERRGDDGFEFRFAMEKQHHFRNANTARSLIERYGYFKYVLLESQFTVKELSPLPTRKYFGCKSKQDMFEYFLLNYEGNVPFTNNHSDALACAIYQAVKDGHRYVHSELRIKGVAVNG